MKECSPNCRIFIDSPLTKLDKVENLLEYFLTKWFSTSILLHFKEFGVHLSFRSFNDFDRKNQLTTELFKNV